MLTKSRLKRWGNSFGVVIPKSLVEEEGLKEGEEVEISVSRIADIRELRGKFPVEDLQLAKDEMREGWSG